MNLNRPSATSAVIDTETLADSSSQLTAMNVCNCQFERSIFGLQSNSQLTTVSIPSP